MHQTIVLFQTKTILPSNAAVECLFSAGGLIQVLRRNYFYVIVYLSFLQCVYVLALSTDNKHYFLALMLSIE